MKTTGYGYHEVKWWACDNCSFTTNNIDNITNHKCQKEDVCDDCGKIKKKIQRYVNFPDKESINKLDKMLDELCKCKKFKSKQEEKE